MSGWRAGSRNCYGCGLSVVAILPLLARREADVDVLADEEELDLEGPTHMWTVTLSPSAGMRFQNLKRLDDFCQRHLNRFVKIYVPGKRGRSSAALLLRDSTKRTPCYSPDAECMRASLINAVAALDSRDAALACLRRGPVFAPSLAALATWAERNLRLYSLRSPHIYGDQQAWLLRQPTGVFILRIIGSKGSGTRTRTIDHVICADAGDRVIWDPAERYAIRFEPGSFEACVGNGFTLRGIKELRQLVMQVQRPEGKKKRHNNPERCKRNRREAREQGLRRRFATTT